VSTKLLCLPGRVIKDLLCTGSVLKKDVEKKKRKAPRDDLIAMVVLLGQTVHPLPVSVLLHH
jgi:hypothetical protein